MLPISGNSTCSSDYFTCNNSLCIPKLWNCDGENDCGDGSDEVGCRHTTCEANMFTCKNGKCIPPYWRCDFDRDCPDGSDEDDCCEYNRFTSSVIMVIHLVVMHCVRLRK